MTTISNVVNKDSINTYGTLFIHKLRSYVARVVRSVLFQRLSLAIIIANSLVIAIADYSKVDEHNNIIIENSLRNRIYLQSDVYFSVFFIVECGLKMFGLGTFGSHPAYFSDSWNWLDFVVVIAGYDCNILCLFVMYCFITDSYIFYDLYFSIASLFPSAPNIKIIRTFRVLRPLKSISNFPGIAHSVRN